MTVEIKKLREELARDPQMLVKEEELQNYLAKGLHFVSVLPQRPDWPSTDGIPGSLSGAAALYRIIYLYRLSP